MVDRAGEYTPHSQPRQQRTASRRNRVESDRRDRRKPTLQDRPGRHGNENDPRQLPCRQPGRVGGFRRSLRGTRRAETPGTIYTGNPGNASGSTLNGRSGIDGDGGGGARQDRTWNRNGRPVEDPAKVTTTERPARSMQVFIGTDSATATVEANRQEWPVSTAAATIAKKDPPHAGSYFGKRRASRVRRYRTVEPRQNPPGQVGRASARHVQCAERRGLRRGEAAGDGVARGTPHQRHRCGGAHMSRATKYLRKRLHSRDPHCSYCNRFLDGDRLPTLDPSSRWCKEATRRRRTWHWRADGATSSRAADRRGVPRAAVVHPGASVGAAGGLTFKLRPGRRGRGLSLLRKSAEHNRGGTWQRNDPEKPARGGPFR